MQQLSDLVRLKEIGALNKKEEYKEQRLVIVNSLHAGGHVCGPCACIQELPVTREATYVALALAIAGQRLLALYSVS